MVRLNQLPYNVIFISHVMEISEDGNIIERPSLEQKFYNMCMGRCDMSIKCRKVGNKYIQLCDSKRDNYTVEDVKDKNVLEILKGITGVFPVSTPAPAVQKVEEPTRTPLKRVPLKKAEEVKE